MPSFLLNMLPFDLEFPAPVIITVAAIILFLLIIFFAGYVKASPDKAYIISGLRKKPKFLIGKAGVKEYLGCPLGNYGETVMLAMSAARSSATACTTRSWAS